MGKCLNNGSLPGTRKCFRLGSPDLRNAELAVFDGKTGQTPALEMSTNDTSKPFPKNHVILGKHGGSSIAGV